MSVLALLEKVKARGEKLTAALLYQREGAGEVVFDYYLNVLPERTMAELAPFCLIHPGSGSSSDKKTRRVIAVFCFKEEDRDTALGKLDQLEAALLPMAHPGGWSPWGQSTFADSFGEDEGLQPHPLYVYKLVMTFISNETLQFTPWRD